MEVDGGCTQEADRGDGAWMGQRDFGAEVSGLKKRKQFI
jgi:hypothetical protein